jgi:hypothetical protein
MYLSRDVTMPQRRQQQHAHDHRRWRRYASTGTGAFDVNDYGDIVGNWYDSSGGQHGFIAGVNQQYNQHVSWLLCASWMDETVTILCNTQLGRCSIA